MTNLSISSNITFSIVRLIFRRDNICSSIITHGYPSVTHDKSINISNSIDSEFRASFCILELQP